MAFAKFKVKKDIAVSSDGTSTPLIPVGLIVPWSFSSAPDGWLLCDGSSISPTVYPELHSLIGGTLPNIDGSVIVGAGTGSGGGASAPSGQISGGVALASRTVNSLAVSSDNKDTVNVLHSHSLSSHTHPSPHAHDYPHTHSNAHTHNHPHGHNSGTPSDPHSHGIGATPGTGSGAVNKMVPSPGASTPLGGAHGHPMGSGASQTNNGGTPFQTSATPPNFASSPVTTTDTTVLTTASFGGTSTFPVRQESMTVYFIIKY